MSDKRLVGLTMIFNDGRKLEIESSKRRAEIAKLSNDYSNMLNNCKKKLSAVLTSNR